MGQPNETPRIEHFSGRPLHEMLNAFEELTGLHVCMLFKGLPTSPALTSRLQAS